VVRRRPGKVELSGEDLTIFDLAYHLRIPVYKLEQEMPYEELLAWFSYFEQRPPGWQDDDRTFKLMQTVGGYKGGPETVFPSLAAVKKSSEKSKTPESTLKGSMLFAKMLGAVGGDKLEILQEM
jgi:hypothetical protein